MTDNSTETPQVKLARAEERARCAAIARKWGYDTRFTNQFGAPDRIAEAIERGDPASAALPQWQPIETAPRDGTWVLVFGDGVGFAACHTIGYFGIGGLYETDIPQWRQVGRKGYPIAPEYWMPLPKAPR